MDQAAPGGGRTPAPAGLSQRLQERALALLKGGTSPEALALSLAVGAALGLFPIIGATSILCLLAGALFRLNHAALQIANYAMVVPQLVVLPPLVRLGERLTGAAPMPLNPLELVPLFRANPEAFIIRFGLTGLRGILAWAILAPLFVAAAHYTLRPLLRGLAQGGKRLASPPPEPT